MKKSIFFLLIASAVFGREIVIEDNKLFSLGISNKSGTLFTFEEPIVMPVFGKDAPDGLIVRRNEINSDREFIVSFNVGQIFDVVEDGKEKIAVGVKYADMPQDIIFFGETTKSKYIFRLSPIEKTDDLSYAIRLRSQDIQSVSGNIITPIVSANIRSVPNGEIIGGANVGENYKFVSFSNGWYELENGYIHENVVRRVADQNYVNSDLKKEISREIHKLEMEDGFRQTVINNAASVFTKADRGSTELYKTLTVNKSVLDNEVQTVTHLYRKVGASLIFDVYEVTSKIKDLNVSGQDLYSYISLPPDVEKKRAVSVLTNNTLNVGDSTILVITKDK